MTLVKTNEQINRSLTSPGFKDIFESIFNDAFTSNRKTSRVPAANTSETEGHYYIELAAPGLRKEDFKINLDRNILNISVEKDLREADVNKKCSRKEYNYTSFLRSFALPNSADDGNIEAEYTNGVLEIMIAKKEEAKMQSRQIDIK